jgi:hypothetical protein
MTGIASLLSGCGSAPAGVALPTTANGQLLGTQYAMPAGCVPLVNGATTGFPFVGQSVYFGRSTIKAGNLMEANRPKANYLDLGGDPNYYISAANVGTVTVTTANTLTGYSIPYSTRATAPDGKVVLDFTTAAGVPTTNTTATTTYNIAGVVYLSTSKLNTILANSGAYNTIIPTTPGSTIGTTTANLNNYCVSALAMSMAVEDFLLYNGVVRLQSTSGPIYLSF